MTERSPTTGPFLPEVAEWPAGIYQWQTDDVILGGPDGIDNWPNMGLANRTLWLRQKLEAGAADLAAHEASNNHPLATTADKGMVVLASVADALAGVSNYRAVTPEGMAAAMAVLIDSAPTPLDTLNKLAAALGNDPDFATTISNALASKAPRHSPDFTGTPMAETAPVGTDTRQLATMEAVQAHLGRMPSGSAAAPGAYFSDDKDTGLFTPAANTLAVALGGILGFQWSAQANAVNYLRAHAGASGTAAGLFFEGADENVDGTICTKGAGSLRIGRNAGANTTAVFDSGGNFLVGATANVSFGGLSGARQYVQSAPGTVAGAFRATGASGLAMILATDNTGAAGLAQFYVGTSTLVGTITTNGTSTAYNTTSDYRLKTDVTPLDGAATRLKALPVHRFRWRAQVAADPTTAPLVDGFLAHEVQSVVPEAVTGVKDQTRRVEDRDESGTVVGTYEEPVYQGIDQSKLVPLLTAALQEALLRIETIEARVAALGA
jgi:hypothetical protein